MIILRNARAISRGNETTVVDMLIRGGRIAVIMPKGDKQIHAGLNDTEIDCREKIIMPGFIDAHVHLREPGFEDKETIRTGTEAAASRSGAAISMYRLSSWKTTRTMHRGTVH